MVYHSISMQISSIKTILWSFETRFHISFQRKFLTKKKFLISLKWSCVSYILNQHFNDTFINNKMVNS